MFGFGKQKVIEKKERVYPTKHENEQAIMRLFDYGFIGKPQYYSNGDIQADYYGFEIWKPINEKFRLYFHGLTGILPQKYRFRIGVYDNGWGIPCDYDYLFLDSLENLKQKLIDSLDLVIENHAKKVDKFTTIKKIISEQQNSTEVSNK